MNVLVPFDCPVHGHQLDAVPQATVRCRSCPRWLGAPGIPRRVAGAGRRRALHGVDRGSVAPVTELPLPDPDRVLRWRNAS
jgi:hypothetical protein